MRRGRTRTASSHGRMENMAGERATSAETDVRSARMPRRTFYAERFAVGIARVRSWAFPHPWPSPWRVRFAQGPWRFRAGRPCGADAGLTVPVRGELGQNGPGWRQGGEAFVCGAFRPARCEPRKAVLAQGAVRGFEEAVRAVDGPAAGGAAMSDHATSRFGVQCLRCACTSRACVAGLIGRSFIHLMAEDKKGPWPWPRSMLDIGHDDRNPQAADHASAAPDPGRPRRGLSR
jgi:hypothetical protein